MKKLINWTVLLLIILLLSACVAASNKGPVKVKCPACGYEFDVNLDTQR
jgi:uncharacterized integral membrane protein